jgi:hypothetical protein
MFIVMGVSLKHCLEIFYKRSRYLCCWRLPPWSISHCLGYQVRAAILSEVLELMGSNSEGRGAAAEVDAFLTDGSTRLPYAGGIKTRVSFHKLLGLLLSFNGLQLFVPPPSSLAEDNMSVEVAA